MDGLWEVGEGQDKVFLHFEPQGYHDPSFPVRMLRYRADFWEGTLSTGKGAPPLYQVALFYLPKDENKENSLVDKWDKGEGISYKYRVLRAWEMDKGPVLQKELLALYPLLPLMREEPGETPERVMEVITQAIKGVEDASLKADLFAAVSVFAEMRYTSELARKLSKYVYL